MLSDLTLFRYGVLSEVRLRQKQGATLAIAVRDVAAREHMGPDRQPCRVSARSIYRWLAAWTGEQLGGLAPKVRPQVDASTVLEPALLTFLRKEKLDDVHKSVPELLRCAVQAGLLGDVSDVDRTTVWRALRRMGVPTRVGRMPPPDARRFEKENRLQLVLCDGKHFRAGARRAKRVALFFIDDASRFVPQVVVGPSESSDLFLRGLFGLLQRVGKISVLYSDHGSAFDNHDSHEVLAGLDIGYVHGRVAYPPGRGKIERFNRTAGDTILRDLELPHVDPDCAALELRLSVWLTEVYNRQPHSSLAGQTPEARFLADDRLLQPYDPAVLREKFFVSEERVVSNDHVISLRSVSYEVPRGLAGQRITVLRDVLDDTHVRLEHEGESIRLHPADLHANARARRGAHSAEPPAQATAAPTSATRRVDSALAPITDPDGGFADPKKKETP